METRRAPLETECQYLKGVGPKNAMYLTKLGLATVSDVLFNFPRRYDDRRDIPPIMFQKPGRHSTVRGTLYDVRSKSVGRGRVLVTGHVRDTSGEIALSYFNQPWQSRNLQAAIGRDIVAFGLVKEGRNRELELHSAEWEVAEIDEVEEFARLVPVYGLVEGVPQWVVRKAARSAVEYFADQAEDPLPKSFRTEHHLPSLGWSLRQMHRPDGDDDRAKARQRLAFEEFFYLQLALQMRRRNAKQEVGIAFPISGLASNVQGLVGLFGADGERADGETLWHEAERLFPFDLTGAQRRVVGEVWADMERPAPMNRLVQGDVGSGKTAVAACAMLAAARCGYQAALMAPTEILAEQHYFGLHRTFDPLGIRVELLVGRMGAKAKRRATERVASGEAAIVVGTHALIQEGVSMSRLGLAIIDEQHRFGVMQRLALRTKGDVQPDVLVMTATPIPRTMTMTLYGDLDLSVIDELPPHRRAIKTHWRKPAERDKVYEGVRAMLDRGSQAYFVCPMISENEKMQAQAAEELFERLRRDVFPNHRVGLLHGQMKGELKDATMEEFRAGTLDVLVSTVVIEVGVDVPNASVMVIEDANRFGLSQLHQLRGRVGRGEQQSFCILIADAQSEEASERMQILVDTTDGFIIAEQDLRLRGPGDLMGTRQSGQYEFRVADLLQDGILLERARQAAMSLLERGATIDEPEWAPALERVRAQRREEALVTVS